MMRSSRVLPSEVSLTALAASMLTRRWPQRNGHGRQTDAGSDVLEHHRSKGQDSSPSPARCGERHRLAYFG